MQGRRWLAVSARNKFHTADDGSDARCRGNRYRAVGLMGADTGQRVGKDVS